MRNLTISICQLAQKKEPIVEKIQEALGAHQMDGTTWKRTKKKHAKDNAPIS